MQVGGFSYAGSPLRIEYTVQCGTVLAPEFVQISTPASALGSLDFEIFFCTKTATQVRIISLHNLARHCKWKQTTRRGVDKRMTMIRHRHNKVTMQRACCESCYFMVESCSNLVWLRTWLLMGIWRIST
jgi:hypothetical protein